MRARDWVLVVIGALTGSAIAALGVFHVASFGGARPDTAAGPIGGPFTLVDDTGAAVSQKTLTGKPYAMYFGYTYCPGRLPDNAPGPVAVDQKTWTGCRKTQLRVRHDRSGA